MVPEADVGVEVGVVVVVPEEVVEDLVLVRDRVDQVLALVEVLALVVAWVADQEVEQVTEAEEPAVVAAVQLVEAVEAQVVVVMGQAQVAVEVPVDLVDQVREAQEEV